MKRPLDPFSRRDLLKSFGLAGFLLHPILRDMAYAAPLPFDKAPRFVHFFKGGGFQPSRTNASFVTSLAQLDRTPIKPLEKHAKDFILFRNMHVHGGSPKSDGYQEEHAAGMFGCATGHRYKYYKNDSYFAYTDHESIDVRIANHYAGREDLKHLALSSLHLGGGAHSDFDQLGLGNRFISFRTRKPTEKNYYDNAIPPMQNVSEVYELLMSKAVRLCAAQSSRPATVIDEGRRAMATKGDMRDVIHGHMKNAVAALDDPAIRQQLIASTEQMLEVRPNATTAPAPSSVQKAGATPGARPAACEETRRTGDGQNKFNLDTLSPIHDGMIAMIKLAFQLDLTRVVAFTLSGASSGQSWPSRGVHKAHHTLEHNGDVEGLVKIDTYYAEKFAQLIDALKSIDDGGGRTALYNSSLMLGSECWSNKGHYLKDIPFILAGQGAGRFKTGEIVDARGRNNNDLLISCLNASGIDTKAFGLPNLCSGAIV